MNARRPRALVVDDEPAVHQTLPVALAQRAHVDCKAATGAQEALALLRDGPFDVVLVDYAMPGFDGIQLLARIRDEHPGVHRILITAHSTPELRRRALAEAGVEAFVAKPYNLRWLARTVEAVLRGEPVPRPMRPGRGRPRAGA